MMLKEVKKQNEMKQNITKRNLNKFIESTKTKSICDSFRFFYVYILIKYIIVSQFVSSKIWNFQCQYIINCKPFLIIENVKRNYIMCKK